MGFNARPRLDDVQVKQIIGDVLSLSGQTRISTISGLTLSNISGNDVIITASGATSGNVGQVMTYDGNVIKLMDSSISGEIAFECGNQNIRRTPYVGLNMNDTTVSGFLEKFFFPDAPPTTSMSFISGSLSRQYGDISCRGISNLCWAVNKNTNNICSIMLSTGGTATYDTTITVGGGTQNGLVAHTYPLVCAKPTTPISYTCATYRVCAKTVCNEIVTSTVSISWRDTKYWGATSVNYIGSSSGATNTAVNVLGSCELTSTGYRCFCNYSVGTNNFFYYAYPKIFGLPQQISVNGLPNNSWGCAAIGTLSTFKRCNTNGYCQDFYLVRSDNRITGNFNINIITVS